MHRRRNPGWAGRHRFRNRGQDFLDLIANSHINTKKQIIPAVRLTVVGPAFFDGEHRGAQGSGNSPSKHGNCNSSDSALWKIHPAYQITHP